MQVACSVVSRCDLSIVKHLASHVPCQYLFIYYSFFFLPLRIPIYFIFILF